MKKVSIVMSLLVTLLLLATSCAQTVKPTPPPYRQEKKEYQILTSDNYHNQDLKFVFDSYKLCFRGTATEGLIQLVAPTTITNYSSDVIDFSGYQIILRFDDRDEFFADQKITELARGKIELELTFTIPASIGTSPSKRLVMFLVFPDGGYRFWVFQVGMNHIWD